MKKDLSHLDKHKRPHPTATGDDGGMWRIKTLTIVASWGGGWDHVSVSKPNKTPSFEEMDKVKRLFFEPDEVAMQLHVQESNHISLHPHCLHLWRQQDREIPTPPLGFV